MSSWSSRRKYLYALIVIVILVVVVGIPTFKFFYKAPSCFDNSRNGDELGVDCGGSCVKLCSNAFLSVPSPSWVRFREVAPRLYNVAAYIVNPNQNVGISKETYRLRVLDKEGFEIAGFSGQFSLPPGRNTLVFVSGLKIADQTPVRAVLEYVKEPEWKLGRDILSGLDIIDKKYDETAVDSFLNVVLKNRSALTMRNVIVYAILKDKDDNAVDFSKTVVDEIAPQGTMLAPFTWPYSHGNKIISIEVLAVPE